MAVMVVACSAPPKVRFTHTLYWQGELVPGYLYRVREGDTLASIAEHFECDLALLAQMNNKHPSRALGVNARIFIPRRRTGFPTSYYAKPRRSDGYQRTQSTDGQRVGAGGGYPTTVPPPRPRPRSPAVFATPTPRPAGRVRSPSKPTPRSRVTPPASLDETRKKGIQFAQTYNKQYQPAASQKRVPNAPAFQWPADGVITSSYNVRSKGSRLHLGIDIANSRRGTPVRAAYSGRVLYSDDKYLPSMGNMVLIEHRGDWITVYGHNERNLVKEGDYVQTGQVIAVMGATGRATGQHVHFEIRRNADTPVNPIDYLPRRR